MSFPASAPTKEEFISEHKIDRIIRRQDELEKELATLRSMYQHMKEMNDVNIVRINERIDQIEEELTNLRVSLNELNTSVQKMNATVNLIYAKQDVTISAQDQFIGQLWKAFYILLGVITTASAAILAITNW